MVEIDDSDWADMTFPFARVFASTYLYFDYSCCYSHLT